MFLLWHPSLTAINLSYTFPILETSATALCGTTGTIHNVEGCWRFSAKSRKPTSRLKAGPSFRLRRLKKQLQTSSNGKQKLHGHEWTNARKLISSVAWHFSFSRCHRTIHEKHLNDLEWHGVWPRQRINCAQWPNVCQGTTQAYSNRHCSNPKSCQSFAGFAIGAQPWSACQDRWSW